MKRPIEAGALGRALRPPQQRICPLLLPNPVVPPSSGLEEVSSEKQRDHTWWGNLKELCVFLVLESIC